MAIGIPELIILLPLILAVVGVIVLVRVLSGPKAPRAASGPPVPVGAGWYRVSRGGESFGPYRLQDLQAYIASGQVAPTDMVWTEGMTGWSPASQVPKAAPRAS